MPIDISDLRTTIVPKSDQLNAEQLLSGSMTIAVTDVRIGSGDEQPVSIHYANDNGRPYKPCKTMRKVLVLAWGPDGRQWAGKSMELYNDESVRFGGTAVGGIRIKALSHLAKRIDVSLTATKGKKAMHSIEPLAVVTLPEVLEAVKSAKNKAGMDRAKALAAQLTAPADIDEAKAAYSGRVAQLKGQTQQPAKTLAQWIDQIEQAAGDADAAQILAAALAALPDHATELQAAHAQAWT
jgi:hypothetical protein